MRFARIGEPGQERDAAWDGQARRDISALTADRKLEFIGLSGDAPSPAGPFRFGSTADMIFGVSYLVWYLSQFMVLYPRDVINTGTPAGAALGRPGTPHLRAGDVVALEIDGLGRQQQTLAQA
jgi:2-keto-4-pentenoate hydratase/2-oxohepta-3-ene-1,7-dioic acid hydratase in catechol pathway